MAHSRLSFFFFFFGLLDPFMTYMAKVSIFGLEPISITSYSPPDGFFRI